MKRICCGLFIFTIFFAGPVSAQIFGGTPPAIQWKVIHTVPAHIIFPAGMETAASQVAFLVGALSHTTLSTIGKQQKPVGIVFHNLTTISNGYVQQAPFRSEFKLTPSQNSFDLGSLPWNQTLAIHEYRHVQQFNNFCVGLSRTFYILFGQDGLSFANSLSVPNWFWEGDAVFQETLVSRQGRGRLPLFLSGYEALWAAQKKYSWMKLRNGSYRDFTPNHYPLGYMLVAYGREKYGADLWNQTASDAAAFKGLFYPLQKSVRKHTGISFTRFRDQAMEYFKNQLTDSAYTNPAALFGKKEKHFVADQLFPQFVDSNQLVFLQSGYRLPPNFVMQNIQTGKITSIKFQSAAIDNTFSYNNRKIVYTAYEPDLRWGWRDYTVIRLLDIDTKKDVPLTHRTKYFSPDISPDGKTLVAVNAFSTGASALDILDIYSGKIRLRLPNPDHLIYTYPKYYDAEHLLAAVRNEKGEMCLMQIEIANGKQEVLTDWSMDVLGFLSVEERRIYFTRTFHGQDQGFYWQEGKLYRMIPDASTGNYQLAGGFGKIVWNSLTSAGYRVQLANVNGLFNPSPVTFDPTDTFNKHRVYALDHPVFQIPFPIPDSVYPIKPYQSTTRFFNFHSLRPFFNDPDYTLSLLGENVLNTLQSDIYVGYNSNERYKTIGADFSYGALFPFINLGTEYLIGRNAYGGNQKIYWNELLSYAGLSVPLNRSRGRWLTRLQGGSNISFHQRYFRGIYQDSIHDKGYFSLDPQLFFSNQVQSGRQQINPSFAQTLLLQYNRAISNISGNQLLASAYFYLPGLTATHSIVIGAAFQQRDSVNQIRFSNSFPFSRGYSGENFYRQYRLSLNYNLPLAYPDWGFGNLIYFLRIRANAFFDYTGVPAYTTNRPGVNAQYRSAGLELYFDTQWWNQLPLSFGIRYSRLLDTDYEGRSPNQWQLILPLNILDKGYSHHTANPKSF